MPDNEKQVGYLSSDNGPGIINGLNLLVAIANCPMAKNAVLQVLADAHKKSGSSILELSGDIVTAIEHICELNRMVQNCGIKPMERKP